MDINIHPNSSVRQHVQILARNPWQNPDLRYHHRLLARLNLHLGVLARDHRLAFGVRFLLGLLVCLNLHLGVLAR
ncbi:hypothetical protein, partial [Pseudomonas brenneri]|uniref:hypothetical protein n=1 Tax=Pseudomonas brenneri TaxID=129817 RepID=UPI0028D4199E